MQPLALDPLPRQDAAAAALVRGLAPGARLVYALGGSQRFELPIEEASVDVVFRRMEAAKARCVPERVCYNLHPACRGGGGGGGGAARQQPEQQTTHGLSLLWSTSPLHPPSPNRRCFYCLVCSGELEVLDWGVSNATLEEAFIRITRDAGVRMSTFA